MKDDLTDWEKFDNWLNQSPAFEKDCIESWDETEEDGTTTLVYSYWFKIKGDE